MLSGPPDLFLPRRRRALAFTSLPLPLHLLAALLTMPILPALLRLLLLFRFQCSLLPLALLPPSFSLSLYPFRLDARLLLFVLADYPRLAQDVLIEGRVFGPCAEFFVCGVDESFIVLTLVV